MPHILRDEATAIWQAAVDAVDSRKLVEAHIDSSPGKKDAPGGLTIAGTTFPFATVGRLLVVGAGKAGAGMAAGVEARCVGAWRDKLTGWVNVPADCVRPLERIHLHASRPPGVNEPTAEGVRGTLEILRLVESAGPNDICLVLLSGGGSALLPAPAVGISLAEKQAVTRALSEAGANIRQLNCVRKQLSQVKGGKLAQRCRAGTLITLVISDVIGDPLDVIASGPTFPDATTPADALAVLTQFGLAERPEFAGIVRFLARQLDEAGRSEMSHESGRSELVRNPQPSPRHIVIGNNRTAVSAAAAEARRRGWTVVLEEFDRDGVARDIGAELAARARTLRDELAAPETRETREPDASAASCGACLISGGEPVVRLAPFDGPRKGGRNQELVLAALVELWDAGLDRIAILSGGTDGEDGPTDAAGAVADAAVRQRAAELGLDPAEFLAVNNAYPFFARTAALIRTGPTHTNVMDVRVALIAAAASNEAALPHEIRRHESR